MLDDYRFPQIFRSYFEKVKQLDIDQRALEETGNNNGWLHDNVIDAYFQLLEHRCRLETNNRPRHLFLGSYMCSILELRWKQGEGAENISKMARWLFVYGDLGQEADWIYVPVNRHNGHWVLLLANVAAKTIQVYDPLHCDFGPSIEFISLFRNVLDLAGKRWERYAGEWFLLKKSYQGQVQMQLDSWNCGVFICAFADAHSSGAHAASAGPVIRIKDIRGLRRRIFEEFTRLNHSSTA